MWKLTILKPFISGKSGNFFKHVPPQAQLEILFIPWPLVLICRWFRIPASPYGSKQKHAQKIYIQYLIFCLLQEVFLRLRPQIMLSAFLNRIPADICDSVAKGKLKILYMVSFIVPPPPLQKKDVLDGYFRLRDAGFAFCSLIWTNTLRTGYFCLPWHPIRFIMNLSYWLLFPSRESI